MFGVSGTLVIQRLGQKMEVRLQPKDLGRPLACFVKSSQLRVARCHPCDAKKCRPPPTASNRVQCFLVMARRILRDRQVVPIPLRMKRVEAHRVANHPDALFRAADNGESITSMRGSICVIRVERRSAFEVRECQIVLTAQEIGLA